MYNSTDNSSPLHSPSRIGNRRSFYLSTQGPNESVRSISSSFNGKEELDHNDINIDLQIEDQIIGVDNTRAYLEHRIFHKQHIVLMLEIFPSGEIEYKEMTLRDLLDRINNTIG